MPHSQEASPVIETEPEPSALANQKVVLDGLEETLLVSRLMHREAFQDERAANLGPDDTVEFNLSDSPETDASAWNRAKNLGEKVINVYSREGKVTLVGGEAELVFGALRKAADEFETSSIDDKTSEVERQEYGDDKLAAMMIDSYDPKTGLISPPEIKKDLAPIAKIRAKVEKESTPNKVVSIDQYMEKPEVQPRPKSVLRRRGDTGENVVVLEDFREAVAAKRLVEEATLAGDTPVDEHICEEVEKGLMELTDKIETRQDPYLLIGDDAKVVEFALKRGAKLANKPNADVVYAVAAEMLGITDKNTEPVVDNLPVTEEYTVFSMAA